MGRKSSRLLCISYFVILLSVAAFTGACNVGDRTESDPYLTFGDGYQDGDPLPVSSDCESGEDKDEDGLCDEWDPDPFNKDVDGDGIFDGLDVDAVDGEVHKLSTLWHAAAAIYSRAFDVQDDGYTVKPDWHELRIDWKPGDHSGEGTFEVILPEVKVKPEHWLSYGFEEGEYQGPNVASVKQRSKYDMFDWTAHNDFDDVMNINTKVYVEIFIDRGSCQNGEDDYTNGAQVKIGTITVCIPLSEIHHGVGSVTDFKWEVSVTGVYAETKYDAEYTVLKGDWKPTPISEMMIEKVQSGKWEGDMVQFNHAIGGAQVEGEMKIQAFEWDEDKFSLIAVNYVRDLH